MNPMLLAAFRAVGSFSIQSAQIKIYMLNKSEYSNGKDLRNRYLHSIYPQDKEQHFNDYMKLKSKNELYCLVDENLFLNLITRIKRL
ncbi:MAG: hypothetical protein IKD90_01540 [Clostridiales bacterium]|nr:hypothetical protein [Clostridiales bacterium]